MKLSTIFAAVASHWIYVHVDGTIVTPFGYMESGDRSIKIRTNGGARFEIEALRANEHRVCRSPGGGSFFGSGPMRADPWKTRYGYVVRVGQLRVSVYTEKSEADAQELGLRLYNDEKARETAASDGDRPN